MSPPPPVTSGRPITFGLGCLLAAGLLLAGVQCSSSDGTGSRGTGSSSSSSGGAAGGCGAPTSYCAAYGICINPSCSYWCRNGSSLLCDATASSALTSACAGATIHPGCDSTGSSGGSGGSGSGGGQCTQPGLSYCAACNVCLPPGCPYWCVEGSLAGCSTSPGGLSGCTGPVHAGCDCTGGGSSGGSSGGVSSSSGSSSGGGTCHSLTGCVNVTQTVMQDPNCSGGSHLQYTIKSSCNQPAFCRVCPLVGGAVDESRCETTTMQPGQVDSASGNYFCAAQSQFVCVASTDDPQCANF